MPGPDLDIYRLNFLIERLAKKNLAVGWEDIVWIREHVKQFALGYSNFESLRETWKWARCLIPLQVRLLAEQVFYELGTPYTELITGFSVMKPKRRQIGAPASRSKGVR